MAFARSASFEGRMRELSFLNKGYRFASRERSEGLCVCVPVDMAYSYLLTLSDVVSFVFCHKREN